MNIPTDLGWIREQIVKNTKGFGETNWEERGENLRAP